jgi:hypothetical protein
MYKVCIKMKELTYDDSQIDDKQNEVEKNDDYLF